MQWTTRIDLAATEKNSLFPKWSPKRAHQSLAEPAVVEWNGYLVFALRRTLRRFRAFPNSTHGLS